MTNLTTTEKLGLCVAIFSLACSCVLFRGYLSERDATNDAAARAKVDEKQIGADQQAIKTRDTAAADLRKQLTAQAAAVTTPQAAAKIIVRYLPAGTSQPVKTISRAEMPAAVQAKLPDSPSYTMLTNTQAEDVAKNELVCEADRNDLNTCKADTVTLRAEIAAKTDEAAHWESAAKTGTKWQRFGRVLKFVGCAGAGAAAGQVIDHSAKAAAIGGAAGVSVCSLF